MMEYNPEILGFSDKKGPIKINLMDAKSEYGSMPSSFGFVKDKEGRKQKKVLNLLIGKMIKEIFRDRNKNLKRVVYQFYKNWHRDMNLEFGVDIDPFFNMNHPVTVYGILDMNRSALSDVSVCNLRDYLLNLQLIRKDVMNSIEDKHIQDTSIKILKRKLKQVKNPDKRETLETALRIINAQICVGRIESLTGQTMNDLNRSHVEPFADELAHEFIELNRYLPLNGTENLSGIRGDGIEFKFASRDNSYLLLGKDTGDCTVDKPNFQADRSVENIFWTVFSWILDLNYQIMKVYYDGEFVMKFHILPLYISDADIPLHVKRAYPTGKIDYTILAIDALETIRSVRDDLPEFRKQHLIDKRDEIFNAALGQIVMLADRMGIQDVYAEKFSNTGWIREHYDRFSEIFLHIDHMIKIDHLEDVYGLAKALSQGRNSEIPGEIFMEIQMKNRFLVPKMSHKSPGVKPFALIKGNSENGISMSRVVGI